MAVSIATNFKVLTNKPIDERSVVDTVDERNAIEEGLRYEGLKVYVKDNGITYVLKGGTSDDYWVAEGTSTSEAAQKFKGFIASSDDFQAILTANEWDAGWQWVISEDIEYDGLYPSAPAMSMGDTIYALLDAPDEAMSVNTTATTTIEAYFGVISTSSTFAALLTRIEALESQLNGITFDVDDDGNLTATKEDE